MNVSVDDGYDARIFRVLVACTPGDVVIFVLGTVCFSVSTLKHIVWCLALSKSQILIQRPLWNCVGVCLGQFIKVDTTSTVPFVRNGTLVSVWSDLCSQRSAFGLIH